MDSCCRQLEMLGMLICMETPDETIGKNLARLRGDRSQKEIAALMREKGWKWSQATVWSIEKGERPLRLAEANDLSEILRKSVSSFTATAWEQKIDLERARLRTATEGLRAALDDYYRARFSLAYQLDRAADESVDLGRTEWKAGSALKATPERVLAEWRAKAAGEETTRIAINEQRRRESGADMSKPSLTLHGKYVVALQEEVKHGELQEDS